VVLIYEDMFLAQTILGLGRGIHQGDRETQRGGNKRRVIISRDFGELNHMV
jgi:hypothetical protein